MNPVHIHKAHVKFVDWVESEIQSGIKHNKLSIEKNAASMGIDNRNMVKELTELAIVRVTRKIAQNSSKSVHDRFIEIVEVYNHQVNLSQRTSQSVMLQQYSTPCPIAFLAGRYIFKNDNSLTDYYFEPSAGNGLLTIALPEGRTVVNEIDDIRRANLQTQGFSVVLSENAIYPIVSKNIYDGIITNPPFGTLDREIMYDEYKIKTLDHLMALRALDAMKDTGRAAIIIGGHTAWDQIGRIQAGKNWIFFNYLYHHYHVDDVINIDGHKLYSRQGTAFDVRLILISGRKQTPESYAPLMREKDKTVFTFDELWQRVSPLFPSDTNPELDVEKAKARLKLLKLKLKPSDHK